MNSLVAIWGAMVGACLIIALLNIVIWWRGRERGHLGFLLIGLAALAAAYFGHIEMRLMAMASPSEAIALHRQGHVVVFVLILALAMHVHFHFGTGRWWLFWAAIASRAGVVVASFTSEGSAHHLSVSSLRTVTFLGEPITMVGETVPNPWAVLILLASLLFVAYVVDASVRLWRRGDNVERRRALLIGGAIVLTTVASTSITLLKQFTGLDWPFLLTPSFLLIVAAIGYELGSVVLRSAELADVLEASRTELHLVERRLQMSTGAAGVSIWEWHKASDEIHLTAQGRELLGLPSSGRIAADAFFDRILPEDRAVAGKTIEAATTGHGEFHVEFRVPRADGGARWVAIRGGISDQASGGASILRGMMADITERIETEARVDVIANASPIGIIMVNQAGRIVFANRQAETVFGYDPGELLQKPVDLMVPDTLKDSHAAHRAEFFRAGKAGAMREGRYVSGVRKDGSGVTLEVSLVPVRIHDENVVVASVIDQSWRQAAEAELARRRNELAHLSRINLLGELSGSLAHELNQPLTAVLSNAQAAQQLAAQEQLSPGELNEILEDIVSDTRRAGEVIRRMRTLLRRGELVMERVDLSKITLEVLRLLGSDLIDRRVTVTTEFAPDLPQVLGDPVQLQQVVLNLVMNACDAMTGEPGARRITVRVERGGHDRVRLCVVDTGPGIPAEVLPQVFEPFVTTKSEGLGLGLSVCRTIIEHHGGRIDVVNDPAGGAAFCFELGSAPEEGA